MHLNSFKCYEISFRHFIKQLAGRSPIFDTKIFTETISDRKIIKENEA